MTADVPERSSEDGAELRAAVHAIDRGLQVLTCEPCAGLAEILPA